MNELFDRSACLCASEIAGLESRSAPEPFRWCRGGGCADGERTNGRGHLGTWGGLRFERTAREIAKEPSQFADLLGCAASNEDLDLEAVWRGGNVGGCGVRRTWGGG